MAVAFAGIVVMFGDAIDSGRLLGNLLAFGVSICFAAQVTMLRKFHATVDMLPQVMIAGLWTLLPAFLMAGPFAATPRDVAILAFMGCVQLGTGLPAGHRRIAQPDRNGDRTARATGADHGTALGLAADGRGPWRPGIAGRRDRACRGRRQ